MKDCFRLLIPGIAYSLFKGSQLLPSFSSYMQPNKKLLLLKAIPTPTPSDQFYNQEEWIYSRCLRICCATDRVSETRQDQLLGETSHTTWCCSSTNEAKAKDSSISHPAHRIPPRSLLTACYFYIYTRLCVWLGVISFTSSDSFPSTCWAILKKSYLHHRLTMRYLMIQ